MNTTPNYEIPADMRDLAEKSVEQARRAFDGFVTAAQKAVGQAESATSNMQSNAKTLASKAMGFAEANVRNAFDHASKLVRAKDLQEVMALQTDYAKSQMSAFQEQARELGTIVQTGAQSAVQHAQSSIKTATDDARAAAEHAVNQG